MFVSILFDTLYYGTLYLWYLDMLNACAQHNYPLITNQFILDMDINEEHFFCNYDYRKVHEMTHVSSKDQTVTEHYAIPDKFFFDLEKRLGSRTEMQLDLLTNRNTELEGYLIDFLDKIIEKHTDHKLDGFFVWGQPFESIRYLSEKYGCPVVAIELACVRRDAGYTQSLFYANADGKLYGSNDCKTRYSSFSEENPNVPLFSHRELIALFGKDDWLPLIPLIDIEPDLEIAVFGSGIKANPKVLSIHKSTEDDLRWKCNKLFPANKILYRERPYHTDYFARIIQDPDPLPTILSCKRIAALASNSLIEAMLWNRTACCHINTLSFAFQCEKDFTSMNKVSISYLNYLFFAFFVPGYKNLLSPDYWLWRWSQPSETEIYLKHLSICLRNVGLDESILGLDEEERYKVILRNRGCDEDMIAQTKETFAKDEVIFEALTSQILVKDYDAGSANQPQTQYRINRVDGDTILSRFVLGPSESERSVWFKPMDKQNGFAHLESFEVEGTEVLETSLSPLKHDMYDYNPEYWIKLSKASAEKVIITFRWKTRPFVVDRFYEVLTDRTSISVECNSLISERDSLISEGDSLAAKYAEATETVRAMKASTSWKITKPIRSFISLLRRTEK